MQRLQTPYLLQHRMAKIFTLLACVGALGVTTQASAQTVNSRPGASQFLHDNLPRETAQQLYDEPDVQHPVGFEPQTRGGLNRFHLLAAAERSAGGDGASTTAPINAARTTEMTDTCAETAAHQRQKEGM